MSQIGKQTIEIPDKVSIEVDLKAGRVEVKGPLGSLIQIIDSRVSVTAKDGLISVNRKSNNKKDRELHGLYRSLINNMVHGVINGFSKELNLVGVGYTADASKGNFLLLNLGFSHPIYFEKPEGINIETPNATTILIKGINKQMVGQVAAKIRSLRKPEPYKGKGVKYSDEIIRRKAGKTVGAGAA
ncbi:MAG: 50S ribosomal protein L6 [bacterium TMED198]|nr:MAG: 50S ribosomal protein L6 [bacterium TMED198]|tara:strand:- start:166 stop:723 length:558 start_codon:yes stop_codon:yes gene_type:complete